MSLPGKQQFPTHHPEQASGTNQFPRAVWNSDRRSGTQIRYLLVEG